MHIHKKLGQVNTFFHKLIKDIFEPCGLVAYALISLTNICKEDVHNTHTIYIDIVAGTVEVGLCAAV